MIVIGDALIDLVGEPDGRLVPRSGGAARNVAIAAARLGAHVRFVAGLSDDGFGRRLRSELEAEGVDTTCSPTVGAPTPLAVVDVDEDGQPTYTFHLAATAALALQAEHLTCLPGHEPLHVSLGAVTLTTPEVGDALVATLASHGALTSLDPNVRPALLGDLTAAARRLDAAASLCDLVRCSVEDLALLHPGVDVADVATAWRDAGAAAVVVTRGGGGATAWTRVGQVDVEATPTEVMDTVGAGDTFGAALLVALGERGVADRQALGGVTADGWAACLRFASEAAAVTVSRAGANPPTRAEVGA